MNSMTRIVADANVLAGKPVIKGTRLSVDHILALRAQGWTEAQILENYPDLELEDLQAVFAFVQAGMPEEEHVALGKLRSLVDEAVASGGGQRSAVSG